MCFFPLSVSAPEPPQPWTNLPRASVPQLPHLGIGMSTATHRCEPHGVDAKCLDEVFFLPSPPMYTISLLYGLILWESKSRFPCWYLLQLQGAHSGAVCLDGKNFSVYQSTRTQLLPAAPLLWERDRLAEWSQPQGIAGEINSGIKAEWWREAETQALASVC